MLGNLQHDTKISVTAAVLAGGRSSRMGTDKALLPWKGQTLVRHQLATVRALNPVQALISGKPGVEYDCPGVSVVIDRVPEQGPLGGIEAALSATTASHVVVLAVDMPDMTTAFLSRLIAACRVRVGVVPHGSNGWEPLAAIYPREIHPLFQERLNAGRLSLQGAIDAAVREGVVMPFELGEADAPLFRNLNEPGDL